jgi:hypothetical protein
MVFTVSSDWAVLSWLGTEEGHTEFRQQIPGAVYAATTLEAIQAINSKVDFLFFKAEREGYFRATPTETSNIYLLDPGRTYLLFRRTADLRAAA